MEQESQIKARREYEEKLQVLADKIAKEWKADRALVEKPRIKYRTAPAPVHVPVPWNDMDRLEAQMIHNSFELDKLNRNLDDIKFQLRMDSMQRDRNYRQQHRYDFMKLPGLPNNQCDY